jgi:hypothetical protein
MDLSWFLLTSYKRLPLQALTSFTPFFTAGIIMTWQILVGCNLNIIFTLGVLQIIVLNQYHVVLVEQSFYFVSHKNIKEDPPSPLHSWVIDYNIQYLYNNKKNTYLHISAPYALCWKKIHPAPPAFG